jgi:hypothetical protein
MFRKLVWLTGLCSDCMKNWREGNWEMANWEIGKLLKR